jgi:hypothetical protein
MKKIILKSKRDQEIFFDAILNPREPSANLLKVAKQYNDLINKNNPNVDD